VKRLEYLGDTSSARWEEDLPDGKRLIGETLRGPELYRAQLEAQAQRESERQCDEVIDVLLAAPSPPPPPSHRSPGLSARMGLHSNSDLATRWAAGLTTHEEQKDWGERFAHPEL
jgi:hypothetical protein